MATIPGQYIAIFVIMILLNVTLGITNISADGSGEAWALYMPDNCYYDPDTAPDSDPAVSQGTTSQDIVDELVYPTNSTNTSGGLFGDGSILNSLTQSVEATGKALEVAKNYIAGGHIGNTIGNITMGCEYNESTDEWESATNPIWTYLVGGPGLFEFGALNGAFVFMLVITIFSFIRGFSP